MFGNYPINDDWLFVRQVEAFSQGIYTLSAEIDPSFVFQGLLGLIWGKLFGISFYNLQILTFLVSLLGTVGFYFILRHLKVNKNIRVLSTLLFFFNPIFFTSSFTFMTDNYFLTFMIWSVFFYIKYLLSEEKKLKDIVLGSLFMICAILIRQLGALIGIALIMVLIPHFQKKLRNFKSNEIKALFLLIVSIVIGLVITYIWPRFGANRVYIKLENIFLRFQLILLSLLYFPIFIFPLFVGLKNKLLNNKLAFLTSFCFLFIFLYLFDFFPVGNVLYLENLYSKSDFKSNFSLFDNIFFKLSFAGILSYSISKYFAFFVKRKALNQYKNNLVVQFVSILYIFNLLILFISSDFYDRYLLPLFFCYFVLTVLKFGKLIKINKRVIIFSVVLFFISFSLHWEYSAKNKLKWKQAHEISKTKEIFTEIVLNDTYVNYIVTKEENDFTGLIERRSSFEPKCYIQEYTYDTDSKLLKAAQSFESYIDENIIEKKKPYRVLKKQKPKIKNNLNRLEYNERYFSFLYDLVGKKAYVGTFCVD